MMSRFYTVPLAAGTAFTTTCDLLNVAATSGMMFKLHQLEVSAEAQVTVQELRVSIQRWTATVTNGSSGAAVTPVPLLSTDAAATITARGGDTTRATNSGSKSVLFSLGFNVLNGLIFVPAPEFRPSFSISQNMIVGLEIAPSSSMIIEAYAILEELG